MHISDGSESDCSRLNQVIPMKKKKKITKVLLKYLLIPFQTLFFVQNLSIGPVYPGKLDGFGRNWNFLPMWTFVF